GTPPRPVTCNSTVEPASSTVGRMPAEAGASDWRATSTGTATAATATVAPTASQTLSFFMNDSSDTAGSISCVSGFGLPTSAWEDRVGRLFALALSAGAGGSSTGDRAGGTATSSSLAPHDDEPTDMTVP